MFMPIFPIHTLFRMVLCLLSAHAFDLDRTTNPSESQPDRLSYGSEGSIYMYKYKYRDLCATTRFAGYLYIYCMIILCDIVLLYTRIMSLYLDFSCYIIMLSMCFVIDCGLFCTANHIEDLDHIIWYAIGVKVWVIL